MRLHSCHFHCQHHFVHWGCCRRVPKQKCPWSGFERKDKKNEKWVSMWTPSALHWTFRKKKRENSSQLPTPPRVSVIEKWKFDLNTANTVLISAGRPVEPHGKYSFTFLPFFLPSTLHCTSVEEEEYWSKVFGRLVEDNFALCNSPESQEKKKKKKRVEHCWMLHKK